MSVTINGTNGLVFNDNSTQNTSPFTGGLGFRNRIINGACAIDQRNAGASVTIAASSVTYTLDRFWAFADQASKFSVQRNAGSVTPPSGFINYLGCTSLSAYSVLTGDRFLVSQSVEGFNVADFGWGTANAQTITLSFWARSSLTGTFGGALRNSAVNRSYPFTYTISAANTWEYKTVTIAGDTSGTWLTDNGVGINVIWSLGSGSTYSGTAGAWAGSNFVSATGATSVVGTNGATFYVTGVQLEKGSTATSFDYRPYGTELALCQRYCVKYGGTNAFEYMTPYGMTYVATSNYVTSVFPVEMRSAPTVSFSTIRWTWQGGSAAITGLAVENAATKVCGLVVSTGGGETAYRPGVITANNSTSASLIFSAEL